MEDYSSVFPLTEGRKAGVHYLFQPFFTQQLGLFSRCPMDVELADSFMNAIPVRFRYTDIQVTPGFMPSNADVKLTPRVNHELSLQNSFEVIGSGYSQNTKRNIRKSIASGVTIQHIVSADELVKLFRLNFGEQEGKLRDVHYGQMNALMKTSMEKGCGSVWGAFDKQGVLSASAFFLADGDRVYFLFAASAHEARENGAMFRLIDQFIREFAGKPLILDFEGGNDPKLGRFYKSFGASEVPYHRLIRSRLPVLLKAGLKLSRAVREQIK